ncbi:MAG TPA: hypothetical protein VEQ63_02755, partial [Bryobacteraceae bacterium]|nr:hypothetical protein [Bryobacteraceae bacterium]
MDQLAATCERIASYTSRLKKVSILSEYLRGLEDLDFARAVRFLCCGPLATEGHKFSIGGATLREAMLAASGFDTYIVGLCYTAVGDSGETAGLLMRGRSAGEAMSLAEAELLYARLYKTHRTADRVELLRTMFLRYRPETLKFFVKVITGNLRIGL